MATTIRLMRIGKKGYPNYRIVVVDKRRKRNSIYLDSLGYYNPMTKPSTLKIDYSKLNNWIKKGATLSDGLLKLKILSKKG